MTLKTCCDKHDVPEDCRSVVTNIYDPWCAKISAKTNPGRSLKHLREIKNAINMLMMSANAAAIIEKECFKFFGIICAGDTL